MDWKAPFKLDNRRITLVIIFFAVIQLLGYLCIYLVEAGSSCQAIPFLVRFPTYMVLGGWFASIFYKFFSPEAWQGYWFILAPAMSLAHLVYLYILSSLLVAFYDFTRKKIRRKKKRS